MIEIFMDQIRVRDRQIEQLQRGIDLLQERIRKMKHEVDTQGWPLVPVDPAAIPEGYEAVRVGWPTKGESSVSVGGEVFTWEYSFLAPESPRLIVRPVKPIELPLSIVPNKLWVTKDEDGVVCVHLQEPCVFCRGWTSNGELWELPPWIAAQLPKEWHSLPWDKSAVQQTRKGADES